MWGFPAGSALGTGRQGSMALPGPLHSTTGASRTRAPGAPGTGQSEGHCTAAEVLGTCAPKGHYDTHAHTDTKSYLSICPSIPGLGQGPLRTSSSRVG
jgi:hypothetical protein